MTPSGSKQASELVRAPLRVPPGAHFVLTRTLGSVWLLGLGVGLYTALIHWLRDYVDLDPGVPLEALLTFAVGLMLGVRLSKAYDRWWEARMQWGKLVNVSRNLAIKVDRLAGLSEPERVELQRNIQGFCRALMFHLRGGAPLTSVPGFEEANERPQHVPAHLSQRIYAQIHALREQGRISDTQALIIDSEARELLEVSGACERIKNTLMPPSFRSFVRFALALVLVTLPWELTDLLGWGAALAMMLSTFFLAGGESIAHHMELPFGVHTDDLDLEGYCAGIDKVTAELLNVKPQAA